MQEKGRLVVISGFSGAGKGTLMQALLEQHKGEYALSVSATTRQPRPGEKEGISYFFVSDEKFDEMIKEDAFVEYARYVNHSYGTPRAYVEENLSLGKNVILEIEIQGALKVREKYPDAILVFVTTEDANTLHDRLAGRGTEAEDVIAARLARAVEEAEGIEEYDYLVVNDTIQRACDLLHTLITNVREGHQEENHAYRVSAHMDLIQKIRKELKEYSKGE
ncbi:MAG: guanylate kinase [Lachnospiraceae bacterium]|nr:guanylate kinase [Lachnospiraceae bacterium]